MGAAFEATQERIVRGLGGVIGPAGIDGVTSDVRAR